MDKNRSLSEGDSKTQTQGSSEEKVEKYSEASVKLEHPQTFKVHKVQDDKNHVEAEEANNSTTLIDSQEPSKDHNEDAEVPETNGISTASLEPEVFQDPFELLKETLSSYYATHNPERIDTIPAILESYRGKETVLIKNLESKYGHKVSDYGVLPDLATGNQFTKKMQKFAGKIKQALVLPQEDDDYDGATMPSKCLSLNQEDSTEGNGLKEGEEDRSRANSTVLKEEYHEPLSEVTERARARSTSQRNERVQLQTLLRRTKVLEAEKCKAIEEKKKALQGAKALKQRHDALTAEHKAMARETEALQRNLMLSNRKVEQIEIHNSQQACRIQELEGRLRELEKEETSTSAQLQNKQFQLERALEVQQQLSHHLEFLIQCSYAEFNPYDDTQSEKPANEAPPNRQSNQSESLSGEDNQQGEKGAADLLPSKHGTLSLATMRAEAAEAQLTSAKATTRIQDQEIQIWNMSQQLQELATRLEAESGSSKSLKEKMEESSQKLQHTLVLLEEQQTRTENLRQEKERLEFELKVANKTIQDAAITRNNLATFCLQQRDQMEAISARHVVEAQNRFMMQIQDVESREFELLRIQEETFRRRVKKSQEEMNRLNKSLFTTRIELAAREKEMRTLKTELQKAAERIANKRNSSTKTMKK